MRERLKVKSPCIGVCSTGIGDSVCRGCKRFSHEIIRWNSYSEAEKKSIQDRLQTLLTQVVNARVDVFNPSLLERQLKLQGVRYSETASPTCWVLDLLKAGASQLSDLESFGCRLLPPYAHMSMAELKDDIDNDFYTLSTAHYQRYFEAAEK